MANDLNTLLIALATNFWWRPWFLSFPPTSQPASHQHILSVLLQTSIQNLTLLTPHTATALLPASTSPGFYELLMSLSPSTLKT